MIAQLLWICGKWKFEFVPITLLLFHLGERLRILNTFALKGSKSGKVIVFLILLPCLSASYLLSGKMVFNLIISLGTWNVLNKQGSGLELKL